MKRVQATQNVQEFTDIAFETFDGDLACYSLPTFKGGIYAFVIGDYDPDKNLVKVQIPMEASAHACKGQKTTRKLGLVVVPKEDFARSLQLQQQLRHDEKLQQ